MRCKNCPNTTTQANKHFCWLTWGLCGPCAKKAYPNYYITTNEINGLKNSRSAIVKKISRYSNLINDLQQELVKLDKLIGKKRAEKELSVLTQTEVILKANLEETQTRKKKFQKILRISP